VLESALIGVTVSIVSWWLVTRLPLPKLLLSNVAKDSATRGEATWRYRIRVLNARRMWRLGTRPALVNGKVVATFRVRGLDPLKATSWNQYHIPVVNDGVIPYVKRNTIVRLRIEELDLTQKPLLAALVRRANAASGLSEAHPPDLQAILEHGAGASLRFIVTGTHPYTNATRTTIKEYDNQSIESGSFAKADGRACLRIVPSSEEVEESEPDEQDQHRAS
jgi:hypothetical protein